MADEGWERRALETLANDIVVERRRARRWSIFFRLLTLAVIVVGALALFGLAGTRGQLCIDKCTAVVHLEGEIDREGRASAENIIQGLHAAFEHPGTKGVLLRINSPGGSPVQAGHINDEIRRLRAKHPDVPLYAVIEDICASGGYYIAVAADKIYVDKASIVGSIGVVMDSFGFTGTMEKLGVERRTLAAGDNKNFLDPFSPVVESQKEHAQQMLGQVHQQFITVVRQGRGKRLKETPDMFSGLLWVGQKSIDLGLTEALGSVEYVAREVIKAEDIVDFTPRENIAERLAKRVGAGVAEGMARFGVFQGINLR